jgi:hypothetical protein
VLSLVADILEQGAECTLQSVIKAVGRPLGRA